MAEPTRDDAERVDAVRQMDDASWYDKSWYDDAPITDAQYASVWDSAMAVQEQPSYSRHIVRKLLGEIDRLRAERAQLTDEYGLLIHHLDTTTSEGAIAPTLAEALEVLADFDANSGPGVLSRTLRVRPVGPWKDAGEAGRG